jgi:hypothetical protein
MKRMYHQIPPWYHLSHFPRIKSSKNKHIVDCTSCIVHPTNFLATEILELDLPEEEIRHEGEGEAELESDITTEWCRTSV